MPVSSEVKIIINCKYEYGNAYFNVHWRIDAMYKIPRFKQQNITVNNVAVYVYFKTNKFSLNIWLCVRAFMCGILLNNYVCMNKFTRI